MSPLLTLTFSLAAAAMASEPPTVEAATLSGAVAFGDDFPAAMPAVETAVADLYSSGFRRFLIAADAFGDSGALELSIATLKGVMREEPGPIDYRPSVEFDPSEPVVSSDKALFIENFKDLHRHAAGESLEAEQILERLARVMDDPALRVEPLLCSSHGPDWRDVDELLESHRPTVAEFLSSELLDKPCPAGKDSAAWHYTSPWRPTVQPPAEVTETTYAHLRTSNILERANKGSLPTAVLMLNQHLTAHGSSRGDLHETCMRRGNAILEIPTGPVYGNVTVVLPASFAKGLQGTVGAWPAVGLYLPDASNECVPIDPCDSVPGGKDRYDIGATLERQVRTMRERGLMKIMLPEAHGEKTNSVLALAVARGAGGGEFFQETNCQNFRTSDHHRLANLIVRIHRFNALARGKNVDPATEAGLLEALERGYSIHLVQFCFGRPEESGNEGLVHDDMLAFARHPKFAIFSGGATHVMSQIVSDNEVNDSWKPSGAKRVRKLASNRHIPDNLTGAAHEAAAALQKLMYGGFWLAQEAAPTVMIMNDQLLTGSGISQDQQYEWAKAHNLMTLRLPMGNAGSALLLATEEVMRRYVLGALN